VVVLALIALSFAHDYEENNDVIVLTDDNINRALEEFSSGLLVKFYAPWCGHCKKLAPDYSRAARILKGQDPPVYIAEVDATIATKAAEKYGVKGYPTIKFFVNKSPIDFNGGRTDKEIVNWINKKMGPPVNVLASPYDFRDF
jgi:protein disulfide-isomerase A1